MRFIVCGDNHGQSDAMEKLKKNYPEAKAFVHTGDIGFGPEEAKGFTVIRGNNDFSNDYPERLVVTIGDLRILVLHGHQLAFGDRIGSLVEEAKTRDCQIACFGHTHVFQVEKSDGILCINPGSLSYNRDGSAPSYAVVDVIDGEITVRRRLVSELS